MVVKYSTKRKRRIERTKMLQLFYKALRRRCRSINIENETRSLCTSANTSTLPINRIVWIDMEMTGLNIEVDKIMEIACLITDAHLNIVAEGPNIIIHQPDSILSTMHEWCLKQHGKTGLTKACVESEISVEDAEKTILEFVKQYAMENVCPLAGNSVYMDRLFLNKFMPTLNNYLHYRIIDVSTIKEICKRWNTDLYKKVPKKEFSHRALNDIKESVAELKFYKENFFKCF